MSELKPWRVDLYMPASNRKKPRTRYRRINAIASFDTQREAIAFAASTQKEMASALLVTRRTIDRAPTLITVMGIRE